MWSHLPSTCSLLAACRLTRLTKRLRCNRSAPQQIMCSLATVKQTPLVTPTLDWRAALNTGEWTNLTATVADTPIPASATNAAKAYLFTLPKPSASSSFFRVAVEQLQASGLRDFKVIGLGWRHLCRWAKRALTGTITNGTDTLSFVGGILVEPTPLGD